MIFILLIVEVCCDADDVGGTNHSRYNAPIAWHFKMVSSHVHTNGNGLSNLFKVLRINTWVKVKVTRKIFTLSKSKSNSQKILK